jgi:hypothetical protein
LYILKPLDERAAHRRTLRRAAEWLRRPRAGDVLLGGTALQAIASELRGFARAPRIEEAAVESGLAREEENKPATAPEPTARGELDAPETEAPTTPVEPDERPSVSPRAKQAFDAARLRNLLAWREEPLERWLDARRDAAAYCDLAAAHLNDASVRRAADALSEATGALEEARALLASVHVTDGFPGPSTRRALSDAADKLDAAREAERRAADALDEAAR